MNFEFVVCILYLVVFVVIPLMRKDPNNVIKSKES